MPKRDEKPGCLTALFPFLKQKTKEAVTDELPYRLRDDFLSPAEFSFYKVLFTVVGSQLTVLTKVNLLDLFFVMRPNENYAFRGKIAQKHLDFVVCDSTTMKPLFGIELDDSSHQREDRQERDEFVQKVCEAASFPLLRFPVQRDYNPREIAAQIAPFIKEEAVDSPQPQPEEKKTDSSVPICPKCGIPMVLRTVSQGEHKGKQFYGCQNFPRCREIRPIPKATSVS